MLVLNILLIFLIISITVLISSKILENKFGKFGLLTIQIVLIFVSNIIVLKRFPIWSGQSLTMSVLVYPYIFIIGSHIQKKYGDEIIAKFNNLTIISNLIFVIIMTVATFATPAVKVNPVDTIFSIVDAKNNIQPGLLAMTLFSFIALYSALSINRILNNVLKSMNVYSRVIISSIASSSIDSVIFVTFGLWLFSGFIPANSVITEIIVLIIGKSVVTIPNAIAYSLSTSDESEEDIDNNNKEDNIDKKEK